MIRRAELLPALLPDCSIPGLYIHIPFCFHKCHYCDFYSITRQNVERMQTFVQRLLAEADLWKTGQGPTLQPRTVFFGGGTPSLLPIQLMADLLKGLKERFDFSRLEEWTVEVNPATASEEYLGMLRSHGIDRISFGAQSFDQSELKVLERHHDPEDVARSLDHARAAGFKRLNIDLIYAIPGQSIESWSKSLDFAVSLGLRHYSCYGLTYESNTPIAVRKRLGLLKATDDQVELAMLHHTRQRLAAVGCPAYEISNYSAAGEECRHNLLYWTGGSYVGIGPSAASHIDGHRFKNAPHLGEWEQAIDRGILATTETETLSPRQRAGELAMLQLRLARGLEFDDYSTRTGFDARQLFGPQIAQLTKLGLISLDERRLQLTEAGLNVADSVAAEFVDFRT